MPNGEPQFKKDHKARESEIKNFISHKFWRKYNAKVPGAHGEVKAGDRHRRSSRTCVFLGLVGRVLWESLARPDWSI